MIGFATFGYYCCHRFYYKVILHPQEKLLAVSDYSLVRVSGNEAIFYRRIGRLTYVELVVEGGQKICFIPTMEGAWDIKDSGAVTWWKSLMRSE